MAALATCAVAFSRLSAAQTNGTIARADSAYAAEDRALARRLYAEVVKTDPAQSRALFRLAQLEPSPAKAAAMYARYVQLEPGDPWGHMALGDQLARLGRLSDALAAYDRAAAAAPNERDVAIGRARLLSRGGRGRDAQDVLASWTARHPNDSEAWDALGREQLRSGLTADFMVADGARLGATVVRGAVRDAAQSVDYTDAMLRLSARPSRELRLNAEGGFAGFGAAPSSAAWTAPHGDFRLRWRGAPNAPAWELRAQHQPLAAAPLLIANQVTRSDLRAMLELPVGPLRLRGSTRAGLVHSLAVDTMRDTTVPTPGDTTRGRGPVVPGVPSPSPGGGRPATGEPANPRLDLGAVLALPLGAVELSVGTHRVTYARASLAGYFAPRLAETIEGGAYLDIGSDGPVSFSADLGAGMQRTALQGEDVGVWKPALRAWTYTSFNVASARALWIEIEAYDAPFSPHGVAAAPSWKFVSLSTGLRWALR